MIKIRRESHYGTIDRNFFHGDVLMYILHYDVIVLYLTVHFMPKECHVIFFQCLFHSCGS